MQLWLRCQTWLEPKSHLTERRSSSLLWSAVPQCQRESHGRKRHRSAPSHCSMATAVLGLCASKMELPTQNTFFGGGGYASGKKLKASFLEGHVNKDLDAFLVATVIFKCFLVGCSWDSCVPLQWNVVFGRCLRWNWLWFRDKLVKGSARPHTTSTYQGIFTCYASQKSCFTQDEVLCGRIGSHFPPHAYKTEKSKVVRSKAQTEATHLLNLIHSPPSSPWWAKP